MSSEIKADLIKDKSGTKTLATLSSSAVTLHDDVTFPSGKIIKSYGNKTQYSHTLTTSAGANTVTEIGMSLTGVTSGNKLLLIFNGNLGHASAGTSNYGQVYLQGTTSTAGIGQTSSGYAIGNNFGRFSSSIDNVYINYSVTVLTDAVSTTTPAYNMYVDATGAGWSLFFNNWSFSAFEVQI